MKEENSFAQNHFFLLLRRLFNIIQSDCLSFTLNYMKEDRGLFTPSMHHIGETGDGKTVSDFPLVYFLIGRLWRVTGQHEFIYRGFVMLLFFTALFLLQRTLLRLFKDPFYSVAVPLILFSSPVLVYYSNNFLMNLPAFSLAIIGWFFFFRYYADSRARDLWLAMAFFMPGGLLKILALLSFFAILGVYVIELSGKFQFRHDRPIFADLRKSVWPFIMVIGVVASRVLFVTRYNSVNNSSYFLVNHARSAPEKQSSVLLSELSTGHRCAELSDAVLSGNCRS